MNLSLPEIPGYTLKSILGTGGSATVYLANHHALQRDVALKVMNPALSGDEAFCARFLKEARDTASISNHPNIVTVHDVGHSDSTYYIAMQYLPGFTLRQRIDMQGPTLKPCDVLRQLAKALSEVHGKGFVHQDIKPANVLFNESGEAVLSDFGVARTSDTTQSTAPERIAGTVRYMSPEQIRGDANIDARSDLYSLGVLFHEMLTREPPYCATDPHALMQMHLHDPVPRLPADLAHHQVTLNRLMAKQADQRYASADALLSELKDSAQESARQAASVAQSSPDRSVAHEKPLDTHTGTMLGAAFVTLVLLTGSLLFLRTQTQSSLPDRHLRCPVLTQTQEQERNALLELAQVHTDTGRSVHPPGANALQAYTLALEIDPCNHDILDAVAAIRHE